MMKCARKMAVGFLALAGFLVAADVRAADPARRPNIVYINADDLGWTDLSVQGSTYYETPNIDRLASEGMRFTECYAPAANCAPSRACVISGQFGPRHGVYTVGTSERGATSDRMLIPVKNTVHLAEEQVTIAEALKAAGYRTAHVGKWHLGPDPRTQGFDVNIAGREWGSPRGGYHSPYDFPNCVQKEQGEYLTDRLGEEAAAFIRENAGRPFFLHFATYSVHTPIQGKEELIKKYKEKASSAEHDNPVYAAMVQSLDEAVGRVLDALDETGLADQTMVLFCSDNGGVWDISKQWPLRAGKGSYYEGGIREPLLVRWPGVIKPGSVCETPVSGLDFFPTFLDAAGAAAPEGKVLDGLSLMPLLTQRGDLPKRPLFWHFPVYLQRYGNGPAESRDPKFRTRPGSVVRYGDWKLHEYFEDGALELYNLKNDIGEKHNLAEANPGKASELHAMLKQWRKETGAPVPTERNPGYKP